jgi:hypothetical protein
MYDTDIMGLLKPAGRKEDLPGGGRHTFFLWFVENI